MANLVRSGPELVPRNIDVVHHGLAIELVRPAIRRQRTKEIGTLLVSHLCHAFRFWALATDDDNEHASFFRVGDEPFFVWNSFDLAAFHKFEGSADKRIGSIDLVFTCDRSAARDQSQSSRCKKTFHGSPLAHAVP